MSPKISIITISYNSEKTIEDTIKSVISQDYKNLEYIIIDGGSTDRTVDIIKKYNDQLFYWSSEPDGGISDAFNKGIDIATGDVIGIVNSDDQYLSGALQHIADAYENDVDVYRGSILIHDEVKGLEYTYEPSMKFRLLPIHVNVCHLPTFVSVQAYRRYGKYDIDFKLAMDLDLLRRFYRKGAKFKKIDYVLGQFNVGGISTAAGELKGRREREKVITNNGGNIMSVILYRVIIYCIKIFKIIYIKAFKQKYMELRYKKDE